MTKENHGRHGDASDLDNGDGERSGSLDYGGSHRATSEAQGGSGGSGPRTPVDIRSVEGLRKTLAGKDDRRSWGDWFVIVGAALLAVCVVTTVVLASAINARANRIIANAEAQARTGATTVERLEGKLDEHIGVTEDNGRKLDALLATTTTATTTLPPRTTPTTARPKVVAPATTLPTRPTTTTTRPTPPPTTTTTRPCQFALLSLCLVR